jgi:hypothetical protein
VLLTYGPDIGRGFVADDFGWIYFSRIRGWDDAWTLLVEGAPGFYRPLVALSFGINEILFGLSPAAYAVTNLAMALGIVIGIVRVAAALGFPASAGVFGAGIWALNFHGISMALMWVSGRTSLLAALFAVFGALAFVRQRTLWAGWLTLAALLSKEEPVMLPVIFAVWMWIDRQRLAAIARATWPSFAALAVYLALRARTDAFTPATAPAFYKLSAAPDVIIPNALQYLDRSMTFATAVLLLGVIGFARQRPRLTPLENRTLWKGAVWLALGFAVTILIPVRSSLYVVFPTVGSALIGLSVGTAVWRSIPDRRRRAALAALALFPILVLPIHWLRHQAIKRQAILSSAAVAHIRAGAAGGREVTQVIVIDDPQARPTVASAFGAELPHAVELVTGRSIPAEIIPLERPPSIGDRARAPGTLALILENGVVVPLAP